MGTGDRQAGSRPGLESGERGWRLALERGLDWIYPQRCWVCGLAASPGPFCARHALPRAPSGPRCDWCAAPLPKAVPDGERCAACRRSTRGCPRTVVLGDYALDEGLREQILAFKHAGRRDLAGPLGAALGARWHGVSTPGMAWSAHSSWILSPVPLHALRRLERGYDQAALLAEAVAEQVGARCARLLRRGRATAPQGTPGVPSRQANVDGAFSLRRRWRDPGRAQGATVVLVDDVVTSGAAAASAARVLRGAGYQVAGILALARAAGRGASGGW